MEKYLDHLNAGLFFLSLFTSLLTQLYWLMPATIQSVDEYIDQSADFAKPILLHLRRLVHQACPLAAEAIKWSFPNFQYKGSILCHMAAFKQHCTFGFWHSSAMSDPHHLLKTGKEKNAMGNFGQIKSVEELPARQDHFILYSAGYALN